MSTLKSYVAFLRGINVGKKIIKMDDLKNVFESLGFVNIKIVLASGNVRFESPERDMSILKQQIEAGLEKRFGFRITILVRKLEDIRKLIESNPFKGIEITSETRLYVTFLSKPAEKVMDIPYKFPNGNLIIIYLSKDIVCSIIQLSPKFGTTDMMSFMEKQFGKDVTTRNWNTVLKINSI
jgi:uncharacterized protein (DUF1697 family)